MINITDLERELLIEISHSDFSSDGMGFSWCYRDNMGYDRAWIKQMRGCIASLSKKGVINSSIDYDNWEQITTTWVGVYPDYIRDATDEEKSVENSIAKWTGKCYTGLSQIICDKANPKEEEE